MNVLKQTRAAGKRVFYGWWVVAAASFLHALGVGSVFYGFNTFFTPMINEFGWSRAVTSGAFSLSRLEGGIEGPIVGWLIDRFGARKLAFIGVTLAGAGYIALIRVNNNVLSLYLIFGLLIAIGHNTGFTHACMAIGAKWFIKKRSRALSFITTGGGIGGAVMVPLLAWLITQYGWRPAAVIAGLMLFILGLPAAFIMRSTPEEKGLLPDGEVVAQSHKATPETQLPRLEKQSRATDASAGEADFTVGEALRTRAYRLYAAGMILRTSVIASLVIHQIPHLVDMGIPYPAAAGVLGTMVLMSVPGRLLFGWIGDMFNKRYLLFVTCLLQAIGVWIFINATTIGMVYLFVVIFGFGHGGSLPLHHGLRADLFGRRIFATMGGITTAITMVATVGTPVLAGYLYDVTQTYRVAFYFLLAAISLSGFAFLLIRRPKPPVRLTGTNE